MILELSRKTASSSAEDTSQGKDLWTSFFIKPQFSLRQSRESNPQNPGQIWKYGSPKVSRGKHKLNRDNILTLVLWAICAGRALPGPPALRSPSPPECLQHQPPMHNLTRDLQTRNPASKFQARTKWQPGRQMEKLISQSPSANPFFGTLIHCLGWLPESTSILKIYLPKSRAQKSGTDNAQEHWITSLPLLVNR